MNVSLLNPDGIFKPDNFRAAQELGFGPRRPITLVGVAALSNPRC